jgi:hypothetical protein
MQIRGNFTQNTTDMIFMLHYIDANTWTIYRVRFVVGTCKCRVSGLSGRMNDVMSFSVIYCMAPFEYLKQISYTTCRGLKGSLLVVAYVWVSECESVSAFKKYVCSILYELEYQFFTLYIYIYIYIFFFLSCKR